MTRFVILHHTDWPGHPDHYDLMFQLREASDENETTLLNYASVVNEVPAPGSLFSFGSPHRQFYLRYEGEISQQRGRVKRLDEGLCTILDATDATNFLKVELTGQRLRGIFTVRWTDDFVYVLELIPSPPQAKKPTRA